MRKRVSKRLSKVLSMRLGIANNNDKKLEPADLGNDCVRYQGVSVAFLQRFFHQLLQDDMAPKVHLLVLQKHTQGLTAGTTVQLVNELSGGGLMCSAPFVGMVTIQSEDAVSKARTDWTIEDVCEYVILPMCLRQNCFFLDVTDSQDIGRTYQGAFVSIARKSCFAELVDSLVDHFTSKKVPLEEAFVWMDVFCANQPKLLSKDEGLSEAVKKKRWDQLTFGLHDAIKHFEYRLIFFNTWINPDPLQRAWCLWEIFGTIRSGKSVDIIFGRGAMNHFVETLQNEFESIMQNLADVDLRKAKCHSEEDLKMIHRAVETSLEGGFDELNNLIVGKLRDWLLDSSKAAVAQFRKKGSSSSKEELAHVLNQAGEMLRDHGQYETALQFYRESFAICQELFGNASPSVAVRLNNIGLVYGAQGKYSEALKSYSEALEMDRKALGNDHPSVAVRLSNIGLVHYAQGRFDEALTSTQEALRIDRLAFGNDNSNVAVRLNNIGLAYYSLQKYDEALKYFDEAVTIDRRVVGNDHPDVAVRLNNIGLVYHSQGRYDEALRHLKEAAVIDRKALGDDHPKVATRLNNIGEVYREQGKYDKALICYNEAVAIDRGAFGHDHPNMAIRLNNIGLVYDSQGDYDEALKYYNEAVAIDRKAYGNDHPNLSTRLNNIGMVYESQGKPDTALKYYDEAIAIDRKAFGNDHPNVATRLVNIGAVYYSQGKYDEAREVFTEALQIFTQAFGASHPNTESTQQWLSNLN